MGDVICMLYYCCQQITQNVVGQMNNNTSTNPDLRSVKEILARAKKHQGEFNSLTGGRIWRIDECHEWESGEWVYTLICDREILIKAEPILADCATNIASALDNLIGAMTRANGITPDKKSRKKLYFPAPLADRDFQNALAQIKPFTGVDMTKIIEEHRDSEKPYIPFIKAVKEISNAAKHWKLVAANPDAHGIAINRQNAKQEIIQIPTGTFERSGKFEFYRTGERLSSIPMGVVTSLEVSGLCANLPRSPEFILSNSIRYVEGIIDAIEKAQP